MKKLCKCLHVLDPGASAYHVRCMKARKLISSAKEPSCPLMCEERRGRVVLLVRLSSRGAIGRARCILRVRRNGSSLSLSLSLDRGSLSLERSRRRSREEESISKKHALEQKKKEEAPPTFSLSLSHAQTSPVSLHVCEKSALPSLYFKSSVTHASTMLQPPTHLRIPSISTTDYSSSLPLCRPSPREEISFSVYPSTAPSPSSKDYGHVSLPWDTPYTWYLVTLIVMIVGSSMLTLALINWQS